MPPVLMPSRFSSFLFSALKQIELAKYQSISSLNVLVHGNVGHRITCVRRSRACACLMCGAGAGDACFMWHHHPTTATTSTDTDTSAIVNLANCTTSRLYIHLCMWMCIACAHACTQKHEVIKPIIIPLPAFKRRRLCAGLYLSLTTQRTLNCVCICCASCTRVPCCVMIYAVRPLIYELHSMLHAPRART